MKETKLTIKQELFCKYYIENKGNGTKAHMKAFGTKKYDTAKVEASRLLTKPNILKKIDELMEESGLNDVCVDFELWKTILQDENMPAKMRAITEYNKLKKRYDEPIQVNDTHVIVDLSGMTLKEVEAYRQKLL